MEEGTQGSCEGGKVIPISKLPQSTGSRGRHSLPASHLQRESATHSPEFTPPEISYPIPQNSLSLPTGFNKTLTAWPGPIIEVLEITGIRIPWKNSLESTEQLKV